MILASPSNSQKLRQQSYLIYLKTTWGGVNTLRQTPNQSGVIGNVKFSSEINYAKSADFLVTSEANEIQELNMAKKSNAKVVYIFMENPEIIFPDLTGRNTPDIIISPYNHALSPQETRSVIYAPCVPWFYGIEFATNQGLMHIPKRTCLDLNEIFALKKPKKTKLLSMICSGKTWTKGHQWRCSVAEAMNNYFGSEIDIYGFGHEPLADKKDAIDPYLFTITIENGSHANYITEKVVDSLIGWSIPIYGGAENISEFLGVDIPTIEYGCKKEDAVKLAKKIISSGGLSEQGLKKLRDSALQKLNLFQALPDILGLK